MSQRPSSLQLAILSDSELAEKIAEVLAALNAHDPRHGDNADDHALYESLKNEENRRRIVSQIGER
ncbi:MAG: hypothetical protein LCI00_31510 [Chloroflexi bacterium]|nr:hypothetical protein [Chloroflexota bacterium]MCC6893239.1 hypothetical protein [Anaerolineae bacterium]